jgi:Flp pilus assembly protein TadD
VCLLEIHQPAAAEHVFLDLQRLDPRSAQASNGLGAVALARGEAASAKAHFTQTLQFDSHNIEARRGLAIVSESFDHNPREALRICEEIRALDPDAAGVNDCISRNLAGTDGGRPRP